MPSVPVALGVPETLSEADSLAFCGNRRGEPHHADECASTVPLQRDQTNEDGPSRFLHADQPQGISLRACTTRSCARETEVR